MRFARAGLVSTLLALCAFGCGDSSQAPPPEEDQVQASVTMTVGTTGATVSIDGATLSIPAGALASDTAITVQRLSSVPTRFSSWMDTSATVYRLLPSGQRFAKNVEIRLLAPVDPLNEDIGALWTESGEPVFASWRREADYIVAANNHFSSFGFLSWRHIKFSAWLATRAAVKVASAGINTLYVIGMVELAALCRVTGRGGVNQRPCPGPRQSDGTDLPLCLGPLFTGGTELFLNQRTQRCENFGNQLSITKQSTTWIGESAILNLLVGNAIGQTMFSVNDGPFGDESVLIGLPEGYHRIVARDEFGRSGTLNSVSVDRVDYFVQNMVGKLWRDSGGGGSCGNYPAIAVGAGTVRLWYGCGGSGSSGQNIVFSPGRVSPTGPITPGVTRIVGYSGNLVSTFNGFTIQHELLTFEQNSFSIRNVTTGTVATWTAN